MITHMDAPGTILAALGKLFRQRGMFSWRRGYLENQGHVETYVFRFPQKKGGRLAPVLPAGGGQTFPAMRRIKVLIGPKRDNARRIDVMMGHVIMAFDMIQVHRVGHLIILIEVLQVAKQMGIIHDAPDVALEMPMIHRIEPDERHE